ncbi:MAG: 50S ribosomal protein L6 [Alphaproteobacteria bacterium]|nr:50S ribosomal protein L6 [Alphaproteobacteria bacterium]
MSRVGKHAVQVPQGVTVEVKDRIVSVKGKLGNLNTSFSHDVTVKVEDGKVVVAPRDDSKRSRAMWGTVRQNVSGMIKGVTDGFKKTLEIDGVGFRAAVQGKDLVLQLGFSHEVKYHPPEGVTLKAEKPTLVSITGTDKQQVGQVAAEIRAFRKPEPYKGKGIKYTGEWILRKEGKKK